jgi:hypothetical protein
MYNGLKALAPYAHTNVHAKYWNRRKDNNVARSVKIMRDAGFEGNVRAVARSICFSAVTSAAPYFERAFAVAAALA